MIFNLKLMVFTFQMMNTDSWPSDWYGPSFLSEEIGDNLNENSELVYK
jgi:hypothetical protein